MGPPVSQRSFYGNELWLFVFPEEHVSEFACTAVLRKHTLVLMAVKGPAGRKVPKDCLEVLQLPLHGAPAMGWAWFPGLWTPGLEFSRVEGPCLSLSVPRPPLAFPLPLAQSPALGWSSGWGQLCQP